MTKEIIKVLVSKDELIDWWISRLELDDPDCIFPLDISIWNEEETILSPAEEVEYRKWSSSFSSPAYPKRVVLSNYQKKKCDQRNLKKCVKP
jgi:hypothetical protein